MPRKAKYTKRKRSNKNKLMVKDSTPGTSNRDKKIINIWQVNKSLILTRRNAVMKYESYLTPTSVANVGSQTFYFSLGSLFDPNYQANNVVGSNTSVAGYGYWLGPLVGQYTKYRVNYVDVCVTGMNVTAGTICKLVASATAIGVSDYDTTDWIQDIALRRGALSMDLEYFGDAQQKTLKFRVYNNEILGLTRAEYRAGFYVAYDQNTAATPWLAISIGDGSQANGSGGATMSRGKITLEYHVVLINPVMEGAS